MKVCGNFRNQKENSVLKYQVEYILYGFGSDASNLSACAAALFAVRSAGNLIAIYGNSSMKTQAEAVAEVLCCLIACPELAPVLKNILLVIWAVAEAIADVKTLLDGGNVPLLKKEGQWSLSLSNVLSGSFWAAGKRRKGCLIRRICVCFWD